MSRALRNRTPVRVGVAGWDYPDWRGVLYPQPRPRGFDPVRFLARYLDLVEINSTFYRPASVEVAKRWVARARDLPRFRYTAKLYRRFTHERTSAWTAAERAEVHAGLEVLAGGGVLDALLLQFPWSFRNTEVEREWIATCSVRSRPTREWFRRAAGRAARYDYLYSPAELEPWVARTETVAQHPATNRVDVVFNNRYRAQAVVNALQFRALLEGEPAAAPRSLIATYPDALLGCTLADETPAEGARQRAR